MLHGRRAFHSCTLPRNVFHPAKWSSRGPRAGHREKAPHTVCREAYRAFRGRSFGCSEIHHDSGFLLVLAILQNLGGTRVRRFLPPTRQNYRLRQTIPAGLVLPRSPDCMIHSGESFHLSLVGGSDCKHCNRVHRESTVFRRPWLQKPQRKRKLRTRTRNTSSSYVAP